MSKFSRRKGRRGEQELVLYLAKLGYKAERILNQYQEAGHPDVKATKNGETLTFENKARRESFKTIYDLYYSRRDETGVLAFLIGGSLGTAVAMSDHFPDLLIGERRFIDVEQNSPEMPKVLKVYRRIADLVKLKQGADYLVIKDNRQPRLFIRYW